MYELAVMISCWDEVDFHPVAGLGLCLGSVLWVPGGVSVPAEQHLHSAGDSLLLTHPTARGAAGAGDTAGH